jgi:hypothetical protein
MKKALLFLSLLFIVCISNAQVEVKIGEFFTRVNGECTVDFLMSSEHGTDSIFAYFEIGQDTLYFTQLRKRKDEKTFYFYYQQKAAKKDIDLGPKHIWETNLIDKNKTFHYIDLLPFQGKTFYGKIIDDKGSNSFMEISEIGIYCYTKALAEKLYDQIKE